MSFLNLLFEEEKRKEKKKKAICDEDIHIHMKRGNTFLPYLIQSTTVIQNNIHSGVHDIGYLR